MGSPMRQPLDESGPDASPGASSDARSGLAYTRDEVLRAQTITATSAARMITPGIQTRLRLGCMAISLRARANDDARASHHNENGHAAIPCRNSERGCTRIGWRRCVFFWRHLAADAKTTGVCGLLVPFRASCVLLLRCVPTRGALLRTFGNRRGRRTWNCAFRVARSGGRGVFYWRGKNRPCCVWGQRAHLLRREVRRLFRGSGADGMALAGKEGLLFPGWAGHREPPAAAPGREHGCVWGGRGPLRHLRAGRPRPGAGVLRMLNSGPRTSVIATFTITRLHWPLASSSIAAETSGTIRTRQPSESRTFFSARWLTISSSIIRMPTSAKAVPARRCLHEYIGTGRWGHLAERWVSRVGLAGRTGEYKAKKNA